MDERQEALNRQWVIVSEKAKYLLPSVKKLKKIATYKELLSLDNNVLNALVDFEDARVCYNEMGDDCLEGSTGGYHREVLEIFQKAKAGIYTIETDHIFMDENGNLEFSANRYIEDYSKSKKMTHSNV